MDKTVIKKEKSLKEYLLNNAMSIDIDAVYKEKQNKVTDEEIEEQDIMRWQIEKAILPLKEIYLNLLKDNREIKISNTMINFQDDIWNFSGEKIDAKSHQVYLFNFTKYKKYIFNNQLQKDTLKLYILYLINRYGIYQLNRAKFQFIYKLFVYINQKGINDVSKMRIEDYEDLCSSNTVGDYYKKKGYLKEFLKFYSLLIENVYVDELAEWLETRDQLAINQHAIEHKTPLLPSSFYKKMVEYLYKDCFDESLDTHIRSQLCLIYIQSQTGLRTGELRNLNINDLEEKVFDNMISVRLHYRVTKSNRSKDELYDSAEAIANKRVSEIFKLAIKLGKDRRNSIDSDLLVVGSVAKKDSLIKSVSEVILRRTFHEFCLIHCQELGIINTQYSKQFKKTMTRADLENYFHNKMKIEKVRKYMKETDVISIPTFIQFRVYVDTTLYELGVDERTRAYVKGHQSEEMIASYTRSREDIKNEFDFKKEVLEEVQAGGRILGNKSEELQRKLEKFIEDNDMNVETDIDEILDYMEDEMAITRKHGGFCMKANPDRKCHYGNDDADKYLCSSNICPYNCFMYYMLPDNLITFRELQKTYEHNIQAEWTNAAQKEASKILTLIEDILEPQVYETQEAIKRHGIEFILNKHPNMKNILKDNELEKIESEMESWKLKTQKKEL